MENFEQSQPSFMLRLMGKIEPICFTSPYTERYVNSISIRCALCSNIIFDLRLLKPFIMRESCSGLMWIKLMRELMAKANKNNPTWTQSFDDTLDYSYVRPQHIPAINGLCRENFWPGIDGESKELL
jgi:hypothetical protein